MKNYIYLSIYLPPLINSSTPYHQDLETKKDEAILLSSGHIGDIDFQYNYKNSMPVSL